MVGIDNITLGSAGLVCPETFGDADGDVDDLAAFTLCAAGPGITSPSDAE